LLHEKVQDIVLEVVRGISGRCVEMVYSKHEELLRSARSLLDRFMFEGDELRDDVANLCMKIEDALSPPAEVAVSNLTLAETSNPAL
jgi:hypothetical protein